MEPVPDVVFAVEIYDQEGGLIFASDTEILDRPFDAPAGPGRADLSFEQVPLLDGSYSMKVEIRSRLGILYDSREQDGIRGHEPRPGAGHGGDGDARRYPRRQSQLSVRLAATEFTTNTASDLDLTTAPPCASTR